MVIVIISANVQWYQPFGDSRAYQFLHLHMKPLRLVSIKERLMLIMFDPL